MSVYCATQLFCRQNPPETPFERRSRRCTPSFPPSFPIFTRSTTTTMAAMMASSSSSSDVSTDGPVLNFINKRLRALRKKQNRILQMEESLSQGKTLNKEQEETLRSKPFVLAGIDELEKLRQPLSEAITQEISIALEKHQQKLNFETPNTDSTDVETREQEELKPDAVEGEKPNSEVISVVSDLMNLLYFGSMFDVKTLMRAHDNMLTRTHERNCCLTYDYVTDDDATDPLKEWDLDLISMLGGMLLSRSVDSSLSHKNALQKCIEHARLWLSNSDHPIEPDSSVTYAGLREKLNKITASDYFTTTPEMKGPVEVAAASGNYTSFQVPVDIPVQVEGSATGYKQEAEESAGSHGNDFYDDETGPAEEHHLGESEVEDSPEFQARMEPAIPDTEVEYISRDLESKDQQLVPPRPYQNYRGGRGGGRRGYPNGRGGRGRGYQNGRSQFYEQQPGNIYPRNNHFRGRGGRGENFNYRAPGGYPADIQAES